jgi:ribosome maturation factor RimP
MIDKRQIERLTELHLEGTDKYIMDVQVKAGNVITVVIDSDTSVLIEDCVRLSKAIESSLDREEEDFELRVTSYGADQPLKLKRQYVKNIGRQLTVILKDEQKLTGTLVEVGEDAISLEPVAGKKKKAPEPGLLIIQLEDIMQAKVVLSFK